VRVCGGVFSSHNGLVMRTVFAFFAGFLADFG